ncbi:MAG TPA: endonuclease V [Isosphaeraceae bacterium]|jgi:deoxyribonuclease V
MPIPHPWDLTPTEARKLQNELAHLIDTSTPLTKWDVIAAADVSMGKYDKDLAAAVVVVRGDTFEVIERAGVVRPITYPYVPGLLSFREIPALLEVFEKRIKTPFDVVLCDGQGVAHPRRMGIASHLGLWLDRPTVGCAKSRLFGEFVEPGPRRGDRSELSDRGERIGEVVRTKDRVAPLFVSPGHRCDFESSVELVLATSGKYRLPGPARMAHEFVNEVRRGGRDV